MSDNPLFSLIISEGVHDVRAICKILGFKGFQEARSLSEIPDPLSKVIPRKYPWRGGDLELTWLVAHPSFLFKENYWVLVSNAGGDAKLGTELNNILSVFSKPYTDAALRGIAVLADADAKRAPERKERLLIQIQEAFQDSENFEVDPGEPEQITLYGADKPLAMYIFPDDQGPGTLEGILLDGAKDAYPELLDEAQKYVACAQNLPYTYAKKLRDNFNGDKAAVGVIANALRPGEANQVSIQDNHWFTQASLAKLPRHQALSSFIDRVIDWEHD